MYYVAKDENNIRNRMRKKCAVWRSRVTLTIIPWPADSTVVINASGYRQEGNSITVLEGTQIRYVVSKNHYITASGNKTVRQTESLNVDLALSSTFDTEVVCGQTGAVSGENSYTVPEKGYFRCWFYNPYSDGRRGGQFYVNGVQVAAWSNYHGNEYYGPVLYPAGTVLKIVWQYAYTVQMNIQRCY